MTAHFSRVTRVVVLAAVSVLLGQESAQAQGSKWWQDETIQRKLALTLDQSRRIEDVFQSAVPDLRRNKHQLDAVETELARLVEGGGAEDAVLVQQVDRVEEARAELNKTRSVMLLRMRRILSTDQCVKLDAIHKQRRGDHPDPGKRP